MAKKTIYREKKTERRRKNATPIESDTTSPPPLNEHITKWEISSSIYNDEKNMVTFYVNENPVGHLEIKPETTQEMLTQIAVLLPNQTNEPEYNTPGFNYQDINDIPEEEPLPAYLLKSSLPDSWLITKPEDPTTTPHLYFTENGKVTTIVSLTPQLIETLVPKLTKIHDPNPQPKTLGNWFKRHTKTSLLASFIVFGFIVYSITITYFI